MLNLAFFVSGGRDCARKSCRTEIGAELSVYCARKLRWTEIGEQYFVYCSLKSLGAEIGEQSVECADFDEKYMGNKKDFPI